MAARRGQLANYTEKSPALKGWAKGGVAQPAAVAKVRQVV